MRRSAVSMAAMSSSFKARFGGLLDCCKLLRKYCRVKPACSQSSVCAVKLASCASSALSRLAASTYSLLSRPSSLLNKSTLRIAGCAHCGKGSYKSPPSRAKARPGTFPYFMAVASAKYARAAPVLIVFGFMRRALAYLRTGLRV